MFIQPAQRAVPADSIVVGDQVFRAHPQHGDLMLVVDEVGQDVHAGRKVFVWIGTVYMVVGQRTSRNTLYVSDMIALPTCQGAWSIPVDAQVKKGVPMNETA